MKKIVPKMLFLAILVFIGEVAFPQFVNKGHVFSSGETIRFDVFYNWGFVWLESGEASFSVKSSKFKNKPAYKFISSGRSKENYDWFFKVRDSYQTITDSAKLKPYVYVRNTKEGSYSVNNKYVFKDSLIFSTIENSDTVKYNDTLINSKNSLDLLTALYYVRNIDYDKLKDTKKLIISTIVDNKAFDITINYIGEEIVETKKEEKYNCIKLSASLIKGTIFKDGQTMTVWISNDKNKMPIKVEAEILIGSVIAYLTSYDGLKYNQTSLIK